MIRNVLSLGALATLLVGSFIGIGQQGVPWHTSADWQYTTLTVRDANGLVPRSRVLLRGVPIGEVVNIATDAHDVAVQFRYAKVAKVPLDSAFRIENLSALGETYLSITPIRGDGPTLGDHQHLLADPDTVRGTIGELAVALTRLTEGLDPERINAIIDDVNTAVADTANIPPLAATAQGLKNILITDRDAVRDILSHAQTILGKSGVIAPALTAFPEPTAATFAEVQRLTEGTIVLLYQSRGKYPLDLRIAVLPLLERVNAFIDDTAAHVYNLTEPLLPVMQAVAGAMATIDMSRFLDTAIDSVKTPGAFTVHVIPGK